MEEIKTWRMGICSQRLSAFRRPMSSTSENWYTVRDKVHEKSFGDEIIGSNLKKFRQKDAVKSSLKAVPTSKFPQSSGVPILFDIPTGTQVTPVPRKTKSSNRRYMSTSTKSRTYYHRSENQINAQRFCNEDTNSKVVIGKSHQVTVSAFAENNLSDVMITEDHPSTADCKTAQAKKNSSFPESTASFLQLNTIDINKEFGKIFGNGTTGNLALNEALCRKHIANCYAPLKSASTFHPYSRNQATYSVSHLPLREVYLKATAVTEGLNAQRAVEYDKEYRIRKWLKTLNYFDHLPQNF